MSEKYCLALRNDIAEIARTAVWVDNIAARLGASAQVVHAVQLCLEEIICNIVGYAYRPDTQHEINIALWQGTDALQMEVIDDGQPFDPLSRALPDSPKDLQSAPIGGVGIKLMRNFATSIVYQRLGTTNHLLLTFADAAKPPPPKEIGGPEGPEPTRYGDWEVKGRASDF